MNPCYNVKKWSVSDTPLFESFENSYILTMSTSTRLEQDESKDLSALCKNTFVQMNKGWKQCSKPPHITTAAYDLIDAYRNLFIHCQDIHAPILVLEDDAIIMTRSKNHYESVDSFVKNKDFDVYSLGSFGVVNPFNVGCHRRFLKTIGFSQAVIWSEKARSKALILMQNNDLMHIDVHIMSQLRRKYTYRLPMVVQIFPETENQSNWCYLCNNNILEKVIVRVWVFILKMLQLHKKPDNWNMLYCVNNIIRHFIILLLVLITAKNLLVPSVLSIRPAKKLKHR